ncbi:Rad51B protein [Mycena rebaudengoi]|nr:Rad51B protein [Mycena rebaudengoi]
MLLLGGGLRTGMVWEIFGESSAGKTQMALQQALLVQLPASLGGISGSACYITIASSLPTTRLLQIVDAHPLLSRDLCGLDDINSIRTPTIPSLIHVLSSILPSFITEKANDSHLKPVKLVVIDALAELFHSSDKTTTSTLVDRSQSIVEISTLLHSLANAHNIAVETSANGDLIYNQQSRWFGSADNVPGEDKKEANLGLVWANQVNLRIMLSRTGRRRYLDDGLPNKRQKVVQQTHRPDTPDDQPLLIRRMSVIFSSISAPYSVDYIVTSACPSSPPWNLAQKRRYPLFPAPKVAPLDVGCAENTAQSEKDNAEEDEWENYWGADDLQEQDYNNLDLDALSAPNPSG